MGRVGMTWPQYQRWRCSVDGVEQRLGPVGTEIVATLLLHHPKRFLTHEELVEMVWPDPDFQPDCALSSMYTRIYQLRRRGIAIDSHGSEGWRIPIHGRVGDHPNIKPEQPGASPPAVQGTGFYQARMVNNPYRLIRPVQLFLSGKRGSAGTRGLFEISCSGCPATATHETMSVGTLPRAFRMQGWKMTGRTVRRQWWCPACARERGL